MQEIIIYQHSFDSDNYQVIHSVSVFLFR